MLESSSIQSVWEGQKRVCNSKWQGPFSWVCVFHFSSLLPVIIFHVHYLHKSSCRKSFICFHREEHLSPNYLYILPFLPTNKTDHALILLLCHQGEDRTCGFGFPLVPECMQVKTMTLVLKMEYCFFGNILKLRQPTFCKIHKSQLDFIIEREPRLMQSFVARDCGLS